LKEGKIVKKNKMANVILLAISVAVFVPIWGTFHDILRIQKGWIAFLSAAVFFAAGHKLSESINIAFSHILGVGWGIAVLYLLNTVILGINSYLYMFLILAIFGFMSVIVTNIGIRFLSHTPSLFCGWAIAFAVFGGTPISGLTVSIIGEVLLACIIGVVFVGIGISQLQSLLVRLVIQDISSGEDIKTEMEIVKTGDKVVIKPMKKTLSDGKMEMYLQSYSNPKVEISNDKSEMQEIKAEINKLHRSILEIPHLRSNIGGNNVNTRIKVIGVCGSPHKNGSTIEYLRVALQAAEEIDNVETVLIELAGREIKPCQGCKSDRCGGTCIIPDYMQELYPKLRECDGLIESIPKIV
jgi:hypothetical protein